MKMIEGGVTAAQGFVAGGIHCGIRKNKSKPDLAMIYSEKPCAAAAVYTQNLVKGAPILVTQKNIADGAAKAVICNSGNANTCNADGVEKAEAMCALTEQYTGIPANDVVVASTGVIGQPIDLEPIQSGMQTLVDGLNENGSSAAAQAIMTTDTVKKEIAVSVELSGGKTCTLGAIAKGSGMIHPNMGTMLCFITTDCAISPEMIREALVDTAHVSFNRISVDGDTSTNDTCLVLANGLAGNETITGEGEDYAAFLEALKALCVRLARMMAKDGEGARHLITCTVSGAKDEESAQTIAKSVISSTLTKAAIFGCDANWGRVLCAMGYSGEEFDPDKVDVAFASAAGEIPVCRQGRGLDFDEDLAKRILTEDEVEIRVRMGEGDAACTCWGCDITYDYIKINGDYRT